MFIIQIVMEQIMAHRHDWVTWCSHCDWCNNAIVNILS